MALKTKIQQVIDLLNRAVIGSATQEDLEKALDLMEDIKAFSQD